jgi:tetratricopeptide (TPR) repeat protein
MRARSDEHVAVGLQTSLIEMPVVHGSCYEPVVLMASITQRLMVGVLALGVALAPRGLYAQAPGSDAGALMQQAVAALKGERFGEALEAFTRVSQLVPGDPSVCFGAGLAAMRLGRSDEAETWLQRALKLEPRFTEASEWLGELQYREGRLKEAIATLESALKLAPKAEELERRLADWRRETQLQDRFYESRGAHFVVLFEGPADELLARRVVERLEEAYWRIGGVLTAYPSKPISVVLYTTEQFRDITRMPAWTAAAYDGRIRIPIKGALADIDQLDRVLSHEFAHAVVATLGGRNVPVWMNEGLAVTLEPGENDADQVLSRARSRPALRDLHGSFSHLSAEDARIAYAESAHAVKRMIDLRGPYAAVALLQDLARGAEFAGAFQQRFAMRYEDFQAMVARD